ncbi:unnamed protein product [Penicillium roqueforti FM164]|uniref:Genomic scaffold, ProqFM164S02 n=1 Tax=Penicillium roqueforti (strain FM164) TaxID=1365484 RepID=W6Q7Q9_PENRF|nr:unnamed protein product [Penicillium roqueforti FM164]
MARRKRIRTEQSLPTEEKSHATECDDQQMMERRSKEIDYKMSSMPPSKLPNLIKRLSWAIERTDKLCSPPPNLESNADDGNPSRDFGITHQPRKIRICTAPIANLAPEIGYRRELRSDLRFIRG